MQNSNHSALDLLVFAKGFKRCPGRFKKHIVNQFRLLHGQSVNAIGQSKNNMEIRYRQELAVPCLYPVFAVSALAFWTVPVTAAVVADADVPTFITGIDMTTQSYRPATPYCRQCTALPGVQT